MPQARLISPTSRQALKKQRVAAYCRVSSNSVDQLNSYARQIRTYTKLIKSKPEWELVDIFADEAISGLNAENRPEFQRMIHECELKHIDLIITKSLSRFGRNVPEALSYVRKLKLLGVGVQFEKEGIYTLAMGDEMLLNTFSAIAQEESKAISQNLRLSITKRMETGEYVDSNAPYGFRLVDKQLVEYEPEAQIVRHIYDSYLLGHSTSEIARELTGNGIPTKNGKKKWTAYSISYILSNEKYIGDSKFQKTYRDTTVPFKQYKNRGQEDMYYASETHAPLVDKDTFDAVQELIQKRRNQFTKSYQKQNKYPLTSRIQCSECGSYFRRRIKNGSIKWVCSKHFEDQNACEANYYSEERIYDGIIAMINKLRFAEEDIIGKVISKLEYATAIHKRNNTTAREISQNIATLKEKLVLLEQLHSKGYLASDVYMSQSHEIQNSLSSLKMVRQDAFDSRIMSMLGQVKKLKSLIDEIEEPLDCFDEKLFEAIAIGITIDKYDSMTVTLIGGLKFTERI